MNTEGYNNKEPAIAIVIAATIFVLLVAPSTLTIPAFALGHWNDGQEENTDVSAENRKELVSCLADTQEGSIPTQDEIKDCLNDVGGSGKDAEDNTSINDDDGIVVSDDDPESSDTLNSVDKGSSDIGDSEDNTQ
jgi:hypothetical protein